MKRRRDRRRFPLALAASLVMHAGLAALAWATASRAAVVPPMRVYAVDIVSPPPQALGEFDPEPAAAAEPEPAAPEPVETPPEPEPTPAPEPEPSPAPPTKRTPEPAKPKPEPKKAEPKKAEPAKPAPAKPAPSAGETTSGKPTPSTGRNPDPTSEGGEGLDYQLKGVQCPSPEYCNNIIRQVNRYFRPPSGGAVGEAEVEFRIRRDGSVAGIQVIRNTGSSAFRFAVMEAVEQAGLRKAFGPLPGSFGLDELPISFYFRPGR